MTSTAICSQTVPLPAPTVGDAIDVVTGVAGEFVDVGKDIAAGVTNTIVDVGTALYEGGKYLWNKLFG